MHSNSFLASMRLCQLRRQCRSAVDDVPLEISIDKICRKYKGRGPATAAQSLGTFRIRSVRAHGRTGGRLRFGFLDLRYVVFI